MYHLELKFDNLVLLSATAFVMFYSFLVDLHYAYAIEPIPNTTPPLFKSVKLHLVLLYF
jgi:hypothetical protein